MPVTHFRVRWPDGAEANCYSPSSAIKDFFAPGERYPLDQFVERSREALQIASERVRQRYGYACSAAMDQLAQIERDAQRFADTPDSVVTVLDVDGHSSSR
jgi:uncharacterized repeat protein (TIGR04042 family)